jgi:hypothetical protein
MSDVVDTFVMKDGFEGAAEFGADKGFIEEVELERGVLEFLANLPQASLAVDEAIDDGAEGVFEMEEGCRRVGHGYFLRSAVEGLVISRGLSWLCDSW